MKISWTNLHYFVIGAIVLNFVLIYALSANQLSKESLIISQSESLPSPIKLLKAVNDTQIHSGNGTDTFHNPIDPIINASDSSVAEEIGKSISSGSKPYPIPVTGAIKKMIEVPNKEAQTFASQPDKSKERHRTMMYLIIIVVFCIITLFFYEHLIKKKGDGNNVCDANNILNPPIEANDKYILLDAEGDS